MTPWGAYNQIADTLRGRIASGALKPGDALPSESSLVREFGVARSTVRRALAKLEADALIEARPGTGRVVCGQERRTAKGIDSPKVQYRRIAADLREMITDGRLAPGDTIPSEAAIGRQYGVSRGTARQALSELEGSGLVLVVQGKGRFVKGSDSPAG